MPVSTWTLEKTALINAFEMRYYGKIEKYRGRSTKQGQSLEIFIKKQELKYFGHNFEKK